MSFIEIQLLKEKDFFPVIDILRIGGRFFILKEKTINFYYES
jgi:hypothetical protein